MLSEHDIRMKRTTLEWDVEYWETYLYNAQKGRIHGAGTSEVEIAKNQVRAAELARDQFVKKYAEYLL